MDARESQVAKYDTLTLSLELVLRRIGMHMGKSGLNRIILYVGGANFRG
jgi:hypothetical protein